MTTGIDDDLVTPLLIRRCSRDERSIAATRACMCVVCVSLREHIAGTTRPIFTVFLALVAYVILIA